jgi:hypothetical protein
MVTGLFKDRPSADQAFNDILARGYDRKEVNVLLDKDTHERYTAPPRESDLKPGEKKAEGVELGGPSSGTVGTILAALTAVGAALLLPGLGIVVAGPVAAALAGAGAAAVTGGLIAALHDWGIPNERVQQYEAGLKAGGILIGVKPHTPQDAAYFAEKWVSLGAEHVQA